MPKRKINAKNKKLTKMQIRKDSIKFPQLSYDARKFASKRLKGKRKRKLLT